MAKCGSMKLAMSSRSPGNGWPTVISMSIWTNGYSCPTICTESCVSPMIVGASRLRRDAPTRANHDTVTGKPLGSLVGAFKTVSTKKINQMHHTLGNTVWQRNYYEHVIRSESSLNEIRNYIVNNPTTWQSDKLFAESSEL